MSVERTMRALRAFARKRTLAVQHHALIVRLSLRALARNPSRPGLADQVRVNVARMRDAAKRD